MSGTPQPTTASGSRSRPQARNKKANDDASYFGPSGGAGGGSGSKRAAPDKAEGEPRSKRKKVESLTTTNSNTSQARKDGADAEEKNTVIDFVKLPTSVLYRYLSTYDIVPPVYPSPLSQEDPLPPSNLANAFRLPFSNLSPAPLTPANRPRRELPLKDLSSRRRSSRLLEEEPQGRMPILFDVEDYHVVLAGIVDRHFKGASAVGGREEVGTLTAFMLALERSRTEKTR